MNIIKTTERIQFLSEDRNFLYAQVTFETKENFLIIKKTFVDPSQRGKGLASYLMKEALLFAKENHCFLMATCSYAKSYFEKNKDETYKDNDAETSIL